MPTIRLVPTVPQGAAGGACYLCNQQRLGRPVISTDAQIDYEGRVVICETCGLEIARQLGCASKRSTDATKEENKRLREVIKERDERIAELESYEQVVLAAVRKTEPVLLSA